MSDDIVSRITDYLTNGGVFNPEMMPRGAARDLFFDCRDEIEQLRKDNAHLDRMWLAAIDSIGVVRAETKKAASDEIERLRAQAAALREALHTATKVMSRSHDRIHALPRTTDTELAHQIELAIGRARAALEEK